STCSRNTSSPGAAASPSSNSPATGSAHRRPRPRIGGSGGSTGSPASVVSLMKPLCSLIVWVVVTPPNIWVRRAGQGQHIPDRLLEAVYPPALVMCHTPQLDNAVADAENARRAARQAVVGEPATRLVVAPVQEEDVSPAAQLHTPR